MQSKATTVEQYLKGLPADRRAAIEAVREVINANVDKKSIEEGIQYGMIGWYVPHRVFPAGYHCDPKQPLPFASLASQKNHMALYLCTLYSGGEGDNEQAKRLRAEWAKAGKKLDMGKACIRFKKLEDLPLQVIGEAIRRVPAKKYLEGYERALRAPPVSRAEIQARMKARAARKKTTATAPKKGAAKATTKKKSAAR